MPPVDRSFPEEVQQIIRPIERNALIAYYREQYENSVTLFQQILPIIFREQTRSDRAFHKGSIYYNFGRALIGTNNNLNALRNMLHAYVEDTLGTDVDYEDDADRAPAARFLIDTFVIQLRLLREIKTVVHRIKGTTESWLHAFNPEPILNEALEQIDVEPANILQLCERADLTFGRAPLGFPQPLERRVFIGTNYDTHSHLIPDMRIAVLSRNYVPIIARDVQVPANSNVHDVSLLLLHTCGWAVFDVTTPAGQVMEIERARDYGVNVLLVRNDPIAHPPHVSAMISSLGYPLIPYRNVQALQQAIMNFLP